MGYIGEIHFPDFIAENLAGPLLQAAFNSGNVRVLRRTITIFRVALRFSEK